MRFKKLSKRPHSRAGIQDIRISDAHLSTRCYSSRCTLDPHEIVIQCFPDDSGVKLVHQSRHLPNLWRVEWRLINNHHETVLNAFYIFRHSELTPAQYIRCRQAPSGASCLPQHNFSTALENALISKEVEKAQTSCAMCDSVKKQFCVPAL